VLISYEFQELNLKEYKEYYKQEKQSEGLSLWKIKKILWQILMGINYCHSNGLMHRNLKLDNILSDNQGNIKIADFTLSWIALVKDAVYTPEDPKERERSGWEAWRLWYRAPEMLFWKDITRQEVDIWAVGCIFAELAKDKALFEGESEVEQLFKIFKLTGT